MAPLDFKKADRALYEPGTTPVLVDVPAMRFLTVEGRGDPNTAPAYAAAVEALYAVAYTIKMSPKGPVVPPGYVDYVVGPLEGLWWFDDGAGVTGPTGIAERKDDFRWLAMIRQPDFVTPDVLDWALGAARAKKKLPAGGAPVALEEFTEGLCAQVMHIGPYDDEPATVAALEAFIAASGHRTQMDGRRQHHEIYLGDPRRTAPDKLRTVLRHPVVPA